jgi:hypothetical protein
MPKNPDGTGSDGKFKPEYIEQAAKLAAFGHIDREIAEFFDIDVKTLRRWKHDYPEFREALIIAKEVANDRVEQALYDSAVGDRNVSAMQYWLNNRRPDQWKSKVDHTHTGEVTYNIVTGVPDDDAND